MKITPKCLSNGGPDLMFCCSGAGDAAEIADLAVRELRKAKAARMFLNHAFQRITRLELWARRVTGVFFIAVGVSYPLTYI